MLCCPTCKSDNVVPERSSGYTGYRCSKCSTWNYAAHMVKKEKTMDQLAEEVINMIKDYGNDEERQRIITDFLIGDMHLYNITVLAKEVLNSKI